MKIAFSGASGTGKTTLAKYVEERYRIPYCPVGSRSVAADMGFASPYDVDAAGKRGEFQVRLLDAKLDWERGREAFVTDRTPLDNLAYTALHDVRTITQDYWDRCVAWTATYDLVIFCPVDAYCALDADAARVPQLVYHKLYEQLLQGLLKNPLARRAKPLLTMDLGDLDDRKLAISRSVLRWLASQPQQLPVLV